MKNRYDLPRSIPTAVKLEVRQNCRFGCVLCRAAVCDYEHIDPPYVDATAHDANNICLLCQTCHGNVNRGRISKNQVRRAYDALRTSAEPGRPRDDIFFQMFDRRTEVMLGGNTFQVIDTLISIDGRDYLKYWPTSAMPPFVLSGVFNDDKGAELFKIEENEWIGPTDVFDVEQRGATMSIRTKAGHTVFAATKKPSAGVVLIDVLDMLVPPFHILAMNGRLYIGRCTPDLAHAIYTSLYRWTVMGGRYGILLSSRDIGSGLGQLTFDQRGYRLEGTGISIGPGCASFTIGGITVEGEMAPDAGLTAPQRFRRMVENRPLDGSL